MDSVGTALDDLLETCPGRRGRGRADVDVAVEAVLVVGGRTEEDEDR